ncbi:divalent metal cation transporter [Herbaspirillum lusitanum]|uniref:Divalent metal cation transporter n=1 Tax=Herbaspirillum lusitanum TaxID=213312 RepID=A0ABW9AHA9_9BURK
MNTEAAEKKEGWLNKLGPGLITGAADDDPSGIATYSQAGAQFGFSMLWTVLFTYPLMVGIQIVSARIGRVSGRGLATNIRMHYPAPILYAVMGLLLLANTINIAADVTAMGDALHLIIGGPAQLFAVGFGLLSLLLQIFIPYKRYVRLLKWLTLALLAYIATALVIHVPWGEVALRTVMPHLSWKSEYITTVVAVFGTTISPYLFFWQASQEVEEQLATPGALPLIQAPEQARANLRRIKIDTHVGMGFSNLVAFFIILTAAVTLNLHGLTDIQTSAQAAQALRPVAGEFAFLLFSAGIIGTGLLAIPVLAGSSAYAMAGSFGWNSSLDSKFGAAKAFYSVIIFSTVAGTALGFSALDPIKALYWSAVINGVIAVPIMVIMMLMASRRDVMGAFVIKRRLQVLGWLAAFMMGIAVVLMLVSF